MELAARESLFRHISHGLFCFKTYARGDFCLKRMIEKYFTRSIDPKDFHPFGILFVQVEG